MDSGIRAARAVCRCAGGGARPVAGGPGALQGPLPQRDLGASAPPSEATSAAATRSITEGTSSRATTSWIFGAARAASSLDAPRAGGPGVAGLGGQGLGQRAAVPGGALQGGHQRGHPLGGDPPLQRGQHGGSRHPQLQLGGRPPPLAGQRTPVAAGHLGERPVHREATLDRHVQQVREVPAHVARAGAGPRVQPAGFTTTRGARASQRSRRQVPNGGSFVGMAATTHLEPRLADSWLDIAEKWGVLGTAAGTLLLRRDLRAGSTHQGVGGVRSRHSDSGPARGRPLGRSSNRPAEPEHHRRGGNESVDQTAHH